MGHVGAILCHLEPSREPFGATLGYLGAILMFLVFSWVIMGPCLGLPGAVLGRLGTMLGPSWGSRAFQRLPLQWLLAFGRPTGPQRKSACVSGISGLCGRSLGGPAFGAALPWALRGRSVGGRGNAP